MGYIMDAVLSESWLSTARARAGALRAAHVHAQHGDPVAMAAELIALETGVRSAEREPSRAAKAFRERYPFSQEALELLCSSPREARSNVLRRFRPRSSGVDDHTADVIAFTWRCRLEADSERARAVRACRSLRFLAGDKQAHRRRLEDAMLARLFSASVPNTAGSPV